MENNNNNKNANNNNNYYYYNNAMMSRPVHSAPAFTEHRHSKSPDLCTLINPYEYQ